MTEFLDAVAKYPFMQNALLAGVLASIACGVIGTYVVVRRITYIAGAISHSVLGGIGAAVYLRDVRGWPLVTPFGGAIVAALLSALIIGFVSIRAKEREDTVIGAIWAIGMAVGVLFMSQTPGYGQDLMSYLFGNILMVTPADLWLMAALDAGVIALAVIFYNQFLAVCFDEEFAALRGVNVQLYYLLLLCLTALTVVLLVTVVGIVLVIALLTLPVAIAGHFSRRLWQMMVLAGFLSALFTSAGLAVSFKPNLPSGATTIIIAGAAYLFMIGFVHRLRSKRHRLHRAEDKARVGAPM